MTKDRLAGAPRPAQVDKRDGGVTDGIRGTDTEKKSDTHLHYVTDGIRGADTDCIADGIKVTDTGCMANGIGYLRRKANMNTFAGLQQVLEFDMEEASLEAQVELENLMVRWKDTKQHYHLSLIHISEPTRPRFGSRMPSSA